MTREKMYEKLDALYDHVDESKAKAQAAKESGRATMESVIEETKGQVAATRNKMEQSEDLLKGKANSGLIRLQMETTRIKEEFDAACKAHDQKKELKAVESMEEYAASYITLAMAAVDEAACAGLEAVEARMTYEEKYGEHNE